MYPVPLNRLDGLDRHFADERGYPVADDLAARIVTLPLHRYVRERDAARLGEIVACA